MNSGRYAHDALETIIEDALQQIESGEFYTMQHYAELVSAGVLKKKRFFEDDFGFQAKYPDHPLSRQNISKRMAGADAIRDAAKQLRAPLSQKLLDRLHRALFDCSGAVRHSIARALLRMDSETSIPHLEELINIETGSKMVLRTAKLALLNSRMSLEGYAPAEDKLIVLVSREENLIERLHEVAESTGHRLYMPRRDFSELSALRSVVQIVDRWYMGEDNWNAYCEHLRQVNTESSRHLLAAEPDMLPGEAVHDHSLLLIVDHSMKSSLERFQRPLKPQGTLFYLEGGSDDLVGELVQRALTGKNMDFDDIVKTVNMERMGLTPRQKEEAR